jgi:hypothetical protein
MDRLIKVIVVALAWNALACSSDPQIPFPDVDVPNIDPDAYSFDICGSCQLSGACAPGSDAGQATRQFCENVGACNGTGACGTDAGAYEAGTIDPNSMWSVQPARATISMTNNGSSWDVGSAPDPYVELWCPSNASMRTSRTPTVNDSYTPTWSTGGCVMRAQDLLTLGVGLDMWDEDLASDDLILAKSLLKVSEANLLAGYRDGLTNGSTLLAMRIDFRKQ